MIRPILALASTHRDSLTALQQALRLFTGSRAIPHRLETVDNGHHQLFDFLSRKLPQELRELMVVIDTDAIGPQAWSVRNIEVHGWAVRLLLSFPEVYCVFVGNFEWFRKPAGRAEHGSSWEDLFPGKTDETRELIGRCHFIAPHELGRLTALVECHAQGFRTLFDPTGLRTVVKYRLLHELGEGRGGVFLPALRSRLDNIALTADEEAPFAYLHGYTAYRAGFRTWTATTGKEFRRLLPVHAAKRGAGPKEFGVILSDWDLAFADMDETDAVLLRQVEFTQVEHLIIITGIHDPDQDQLLNELGRGIRIDKPNNGFFDLLGAHDGTGQNPLRAAFEAVTRGMKACAAHDRCRTLLKGQFRHSAPFARAMVAQDLLERTRTIGASGGTVIDWVHRAVLAGEAKELLGGLSRATTYEAISAQVEAEVMAELSFSGTSAVPSEVRSRFRLIDDEVGAATAESTPVSVEGTILAATLLKARIAELNFLIRLTCTMRARFTAGDQVEAAEECLIALGRYRNQLEDASLDEDWAAAAADLLKPTSAPETDQRRLFLYESVARCASRYIDNVTVHGTSLSRLAGVSFGMVLLFFVLFATCFEWCAITTSRSSALLRASNALYHSVGVFLLQPGLSGIESDTADPLVKDVKDTWCYRLLMTIELTIAYLHLGLLVTMLHRRITKRSP